VVACAEPVGHDYTLEAPLVAENLGEQVIAVGGINTVYLVIAAHNRLCSAFLHGDAEAPQVDLTESPFAEIAGGAVAGVFQVVAGKVL